jgi:DNA-binding MarR family transcriptional regulator
MVEKSDLMKEQRLFAQAMLRMSAKFAEYLGKGDVELQALATLWTVAERGGEMPMMEIQDALEMGQSSVSRNVDLLYRGHKVMSGLTVTFSNPRLVETREDPDYRRRKYVRLTPRGKKLIDELRVIYVSYAKKMGGV